ncbi:hypothetical protein D3C87_1729000 [compost metagenome]
MGKDRALVDGRGTVVILRDFDSGSPGHQYAGDSDSEGSGPDRLSDQPVAGSCIRDLLWPVRLSIGLGNGSLFPPSRHIRRYRVLVHSHLGNRPGEVVPDVVCSTHGRWGR